MNRTIFLAAIFFAGPLLSIAAEHPTLTVHADQPGIKISPTLYGIFFEEINRAGEGGLYGQMLQNGSFEDAKTPVAWTLLQGAGEKASMTLDTSRALNANNRTSLKLTITGNNAAELCNEGFHGIALRKGDKYRFTVYARCKGEIGGRLKVRLKGRDGHEFAEDTIKGVGAEWKKFNCTLMADESCAKAWLVVHAEGPGTLWLDQASLVPAKTWKGHGLRTDLAEKLDEMHPAFVRFPGGCYVEGDRIANAFRWKKSVGDVALRPGHWNLWGYRSSDDLGYHEYLQMCEDLHAEPLFVVNCGMAHKDSVPMDKMQEWVQDALDAIEYANGPADGKWGGLRAKAGHPAPFNLKYMEIGNENGGPVYQQHFRLFYDAIKAKYPEMHLVANTPTTERPTEILDEHYYSNAEFFIKRASMYDDYPRDGRKVYVGEYAVTQGCGQGNLRAAVGEAAFMTGMERNSDVVVMSSYAPLFVHNDWRQWNPDAIVFDAGRSFGTPSYYVQKMFAANRPDVLLPVDIEAQSAEVPVKGGAIGVGTWATKAEFKDIKVTAGNRVLFRGDFDDGTKGWRLHDGNWQAKDGVLQQTGTGTFIRAIAGDKNWTDYTYALKARKLGGAEGFLILFNVQDDDAKSWWNLGGWGNTRHAIENDEGEGPSVDGRIETGRWYDIRIEIHGTRVRCFLDGKLIHDVRRRPMRSLYAVAGREEHSGDVILKVVNVSTSAMPAKIDLAGVAGKSRSATITVLTAADPQAENSFDEPTKIVPVTTNATDQDDGFREGRHEFPANSVTIMRLHRSG